MRFEGFDISEETVVFEPEYLDTAIIDCVEKKLIYDYSLIIDAYVINDGMGLDEASEFVNFNTLRSLPYLGKYAPIVVDEILEEDMVSEYLEQGESILQINNKTFLVLG